MRPVTRGAATAYNDGTKYEDARLDLITNLGQYCSYCEQRLGANLAVEHVLPKSYYPAKEKVWDNFLLGCTNCNSPKSSVYRLWIESTSGSQQYYGHLYYCFWPHLDNTAGVFKYHEGGLVDIDPDLDIDDTLRAVTTMALTNLDRLPGKSNQIRIPWLDFEYWAEASGQAKIRGTTSSLGYDKLKLTVTATGAEIAYLTRSKGTKKVDDLLVPVSRRLPNRVDVQNVMDEMAEDASDRRWMNRMEAWDVAQLALTAYEDSKAVAGGAQEELERLDEASAGIREQRELRAQTKQQTSTLLSPLSEPALRGAEKALVEAYDRAKERAEKLVQAQVALRARIADLAAAKGFWSVWMTVFASSKVITTAFIEAYPGTWTGFAVQPKPARETFTYEDYRGYARAARLGDKKPDVRPPPG